MLEAIWVLIKITVVAAVGYAILNWILGKSGLREPLYAALALGWAALRKWVGF